MKTRIWISIALLLSCAAMLSAQSANDSMIAYVSYWEVGDTLHFEVTKVKKQWRNGELQEQDSSSYLATFSVIDSTADSYTISWDYGKSLTEELGVHQDLIRMAGLEPISQIIYTTSELGEFQGIENWEEISQWTTMMLDQLMESQAAQDSIDLEAFGQYMQPFIDIFSTREGVESLLAAELQFFHFPFGYEFNVYDTLSYQDELPNMLGGAPFTGEAQIYFDDVQMDQDYSVMIKTLSLEPEQMIRFMKDLFSSMGMSDAEMELQMSQARLDISDYNIFEYLYYPGIPINVIATRSSYFEMAGEDMQKIDQTFIRWID